jgi:hypothetical protein
MNPEEQQFLNDLDKKLWTAANKLLPMLDAAVYKHVALGLIFLKYVSDAFKERRAELEAAFRDSANDYYLGEDADELIPDELEARDYYTEKNVFWVPPLARWDFIQAHAKVAVGTVQSPFHRTAASFRSAHSMKMAALRMTAARTTTTTVGKKPVRPTCLPATARHGVSKAI